MYNTMKCRLCKKPDMCENCSEGFQKEKKTFKNWRGEFEDYFCVGDEIDEETYDYFLNILPPISLKSNPYVYAGFQVSEPYCDGIDASGKTRTLYSTFGATGSQYYWLGHNFYGEVNSEYRLPEYIT